MSWFFPAKVVQTGAKDFFPLTPIEICNSYLGYIITEKTAAISCLTACCLKYLNWAAQSGCDMTWMMTLDNSNWCSGRSVVNLTMQNILIILYYIVLGTISNYITWWGWGKLNLFEISTPMFCASKCIFFIIYNRTNAGLALTTSFILFVLWFNISLDPLSLLVFYGYMRIYGTNWVYKALILFHLNKFKQRYSL